MEMKRVTVICAVNNKYLLMATECGSINVLLAGQTHISETKQLDSPICAMCHVFEDFVLMAHEAGFLSCWNLSGGKLDMKHKIKSLVANEVTDLTCSPNVSDRDVIIASGKGCIFARINEEGYIVEDNFNIYM